jgi:hypothetical protein
MPCPLGTNAGVPELNCFAASDLGIARYVNSTPATTLCTWPELKEKASERCSNAFPLRSRLPLTQSIDRRFVNLCSNSCAGYLRITARPCGL